MPTDGGKGTFSITGSLNINWRSGSVEQFWYGDSGWPKEFWGNHNGKDVLHVKRLQA